MIGKGIANRLVKLGLYTLGDDINELERQEEEEKIREAIHDKPLVSITYFIPDTKKVVALMSRLQVA